MKRREFLTGAASLAGIAQAQAFGIGKLGAGEGHLGVLGGASYRVLSDNFTRADTTAPLLGAPTSVFPTVSTPWTMFGPNMGLPAVGGHIVGNKYVADNGQVCYAVEYRSKPIRSIRGLFTYADAAQGTQTAFGTPTCIISNASSVIANAVHLVPTRAGINIQKIINQAFTTNLPGSWSYGAATRIPKNGTTLIPFHFDLLDDLGNYQFLYAGRFATGTDADLPGLAGTGASWVCAEIYNYDPGSPPSTNLDSRGEYNGIAFGTLGELANYIPQIAQNNFDSSTGLTLSGCSISAGVLAFTSAAGTARPSSGPAAVVGKRYLITYTITPSGFVDGSLTFSFGGVSGTTRTTQGTYSDIVTAVDTSSWLITKTVGTTSAFVNEFSIVQLDTF